jgi:hypothetical protein
VWLCNIDRHDENLIGRERRRRGGGSELIWLANDHDRCLVWPGETAAALGGKVEWFHRDLVRLTFVRDAITDAGRLRAAIARVMAVNDMILGGVVGSVPEQLLSKEDGTVVEQFLRDRRDALLDVFRRSRGLFGNLEGGP